MKKIISLVFALMLGLALMTGCSQSDGGKKPSVSIESIKTIGDAMAYRDETIEQSAAYDEVYVYVFELDQIIYRVYANIPKDVHAEMDKLDVLQEDYREKMDELVKPLTVERYENLSELIPTQKELNQWIGKTGGDILKDGWTQSGYYLEEMKVFMEHGLFTYSVVFDGKYDGGEEVPDDFDIEEYIKDLTIKSVTYDGLGDATTLDS